MGIALLAPPSFCGSCVHTPQAYSGAAQANENVSTLSKPAGVALVIRGPNATTSLNGDDEGATLLIPGDYHVSVTRQGPDWATCRLRAEGGHRYRMTVGSPDPPVESRPTSAHGRLEIKDESTRGIACVFALREERFSLPNRGGVPQAVAPTVRTIRFTGRLARPDWLEDRLTPDSEIVLVPFEDGVEPWFKIDKNGELQYTSNIPGVRFPQTDELEYVAAVAPGRYLLIVTGLRGGVLDRSSGVVAKQPLILRPAGSVYVQVEASAQSGAGQAADPIALGSLTIEDLPKPEPRSRAPTERAPRRAAPLHGPLFGLDMPFVGYTWWSANQESPGVNKVQAGTVGFAAKIGWLFDNWAPVFTASGYCLIDPVATAAGRPASVVSNLANVYLDIGIARYGLSPLALHAAVGGGVARTVAMTTGSNEPPIGELGPTAFAAVGRDWSIRGPVVVGVQIRAQYARLQSRIDSENKKDWDVSSIAAVFHVGAAGLPLSLFRNPAN